MRPDASVRVMPLGDFRASASNLSCAEFRVHAARIKTKGIQNNVLMRIVDKLPRLFIFLSVYEIPNAFRLSRVLPLFESGHGTGSTTIRPISGECG